MDIKEEDTTRVRTVRRLRRNIINALARWVASAFGPACVDGGPACSTHPHDRRLPMEKVVADRTGRAIGGGVATQVLKLLVDALKGHPAAKKG